MAELNYKKGDKVLFANSIEIKEGVIAKVFKEGRTTMFLIDDSIGSAFIRPVATVFKGTLNQAKASPDMYKALKLMLDRFDNVPTSSIRGLACAVARQALAKAEGKG